MRVCHVFFIFFNHFSLVWRLILWLSACKWLPLCFKNVKKWSLFHCLLTTFSWKCKSNGVQNKKPYSLITYIYRNMILWRRGTYSDGFASFQWNYLILTFFFIKFSNQRFSTQAQFLKLSITMFCIEFSYQHYMIRAEAAIPISYLSVQKLGQNWSERVRLSFRP